MNRLQAELQRLYLPHDAQRQAPGSGAPGLVGPDGRVRAMVLELARPASWNGLAKVWRGVQADLELPAPAIAVSGIDGYQLWFSLSDSVPAAQANAFLEGLRTRYLGDVAPERIGMKPSVLPPVERGPGRWSAFVAPDLAAVFADEPWLDLPPGPDAQADLLSGLESMKPDDLKRALERLSPIHANGITQAAPVAAATGLDPRGFLLDVMNDSAVELHLRIEAAKALLPYFESERPR
jgi:hypothetical protein